MDIKRVSDIRVGDKGFNSDMDGEYAVTKLGDGWIGLTHAQSGRTTVSLEEAAEHRWRWLRDGKATTTTVAQAISYAVDEFQEFGGHNDSRLGLYLGDVADDSDLRVTEVSAELQNAPNGLMSQFTIKTSDGQEWTVQVTPKAGGRPVFGTAFAEGDRVRSTLAGATFNRTGKVTIPRNALPGRFYIRWDGDVLSSGFPMDSPLVENLVKLEGGEA